jgi:hypothetical protein
MGDFGRGTSTVVGGAARRLRLWAERVFVVAIKRTAVRGGRRCRRYTSSVS